MWILHKLLCFIFTVSCIRAVVSGGESLLVAHNHDILLVDAGNGSHTPVLGADRHVVALDLHRHLRQLYWATESTIYRTPMYDLTTRTPLAEVGRVGSLAVDWVHHHVYWSDLGGGGGGARVEAAHLDGRGRRVVYRLARGTGMGAMVLDPLLGKLFWIEWEENDNKTRIVTCNLDGSAKRTFYESKTIPRNSPLAIDVTHSGVYFYKNTDDGCALWEVNYQLLGVEAVLFTRPGEIPSALNLAKDKIFFSNKNGTYFAKWVKTEYTLVYGNRSDIVFSLNPFFTLVDSRLTSSSQIRVMSEVAQPQWPDLCNIHRCDHECVVTERRQQRWQQQQQQQQQGQQQQQQQEEEEELRDQQRCVCRYGYVLREDQKSCEEKGYLLYSSGTTFGRISKRGEDNALLYNDSAANIQAFDVNYAANYVYWSDLFAQTIYRAPLEQMYRKEPVVSRVSAFGLAVDWLQDNVYWTDHSRVMVVSASHNALGPVVVVEGLHLPGNMAVDPLDKYIFWVECGGVLTIKRAGLDGSDVTTMMSSGVTCGMSLTADYTTHTLFVLDWAGEVILCRYDGSARTRLRSEVVRAVTIIDHQPLWTLVEYSEDSVKDLDQQSFFQVQLEVLAHDLQPSMVKVVKSSHQPRGPDQCEEVECEGVCLPRSQSKGPLCVCPGKNNRMTPCVKPPKKNKGLSPNDYLEVVEVTPFSVTLRCRGPLMRHNAMRPWVRVDEVDSLVKRGEEVRWGSHVHIENQSLPFTVDGLNPATTYRFTVQHGVTRSSRATDLHTPPPPLAVRRLAIVTVPGIAGEIPWEQQGVHYSSGNPWEPLVSRKYFLLLLSDSKQAQTDPPPVPIDIEDVFRHKIKKNFIVLNSYMSEEDFDDDPVMDLVNLPWGERFQLAMVQATEYKGSYNLDIVYSKVFGLPDPYWRAFFEDVLEDQDDIESVERL